VKDWHDYIPVKYREGFTTVLEELSSRTGFILIGATSLLLQGILHYQALWDFDLLFPDEGGVRKFKIKMVGEITTSRWITSHRIWWKRSGQWFNLDLIIKSRDYYDLYQKEPVSYHNDRIKLLLANPLAILIDKLTTPRFLTDLKTNNYLSIDIRHIGLIIKANLPWEKFQKRFQMAGSGFTYFDKAFKNLTAFLSQAKRFGYPDLKWSKG